jgi:hypothetical protein
VAVVLVAAVASTAAWLPFLHYPLTPDEAGFLLLGQHWSHGTSLYGDYWVDRPPLLMALFWLAGHLGSSSTTLGLVSPAVKLLGAVASGTTVVLTAVLARRVAPASTWSHRATPIAAAALLSSPLLGMPEADGEVLAAPFVVLGLVLLVGSLRRRWDRRALALTVAAGAAATGAALIKQNVVDVFVFAAVAATLLRGRGLRLGRRVAWFAGGAVATLGVAVAGAATRGTSPAGLWDAIVVFRLRALGVIGTSASENTHQRMVHVALAFLGSGAAVLLLVTVALVLHRGLQRRPTAAGTDPRPAVLPRWLAWAALAMVAWELCGVVLGGSYWLHYLTGLVPGLALLVALVGRAPGVARRVVAACLAYTLAAALVVWTQHAVASPTVSSDTQVETYLRSHAAPADTMLVAFGHPNIVASTGLSSPYPNLWSLPVRVRDHDLTALEHVITGPRPPRWLVVAGDTVYSWGLDPRDADRVQRQLERHYVQRVTYGDWHIWQHSGRNDR